MVPSTKMRVLYTGTWSSYAHEKASAQQLIDDGCVIISQHTDTIGPAIACEESSGDRPVYFVGYNQSMSEVAPTTSLVTSRICWEPYVINAVDAVMANKDIEETFAGRGKIHGSDVFVRGNNIFVFKGDYTGVNPDDPSDTIDLKLGYIENEHTSYPSFHYILNDIVTIVE